VSSPLNISLVEKLASYHAVRDFKCGRNSLDLFIRKYALVNQRADSSQTYVVHQNDVVMGYYSLVFRSVRLEDATVDVRSALPPGYPVPAMLFARFAVHKQLQGRGIGKSLLKDAFLRTIEASEIGGLAAILVDAIDDEMVAFYQGYGFEICPGGERRLMIAMKNARASLAVDAPSVE